MSHNELETKHLPLPPRDYLILFALTGGPGHGYGLVKQIERQSDGAVRLDPSNLYRSLRGLMQRGLVRDLGRRATAEDATARRRYYEISGLGQRVVTAEARRLARLTDAARSARLIPGGALVKPAGWAARYYRLLLLLFPRDFREQNGQDAVELFCDLHRDARRQGGLRATTALWLRTALRLPWVAAAEHLNPTSSRGGHLPQPAGELVMDNLLHDLRYAVRSLRGRPTFAITAMAIIALGIGATTTIFSVVNGVLLEDLPYEQPDQLVFFENGNHSMPEFKEWRERLPSFQTLAAVWSESLDLTNEGEPERLVAGKTTASVFATLGGRPTLGRLLGESDAQQKNAVVVLSHGLWQRRWGSDPEILGRTIELDGATYEVVGVLDEQFHSPLLLDSTSVDLWMPLDLDDERYQHRGYHVLNVIGRLKQEALLSQAQAEMESWISWAVAEFPDTYVHEEYPRPEFPLLTLHDATVGAVRPRLLMLLGAVGMMLLIACANVSNLFLARSTDREQEIAVRIALGASRSRIASQLLTESVLLALVGGVFGLLVAVGGIQALVALEPGNIPRLQGVSIDLRVLGFGLLLSLVAGAVFGLAPALYGARSDVHGAMKESGGRSTGSRVRLRMKNALVVAEIALALILFFGAGLLFHSFVSLNRVDPGFQANGVVTVPMLLGAAYDGDEGIKRTQFARALTERVAADSRVESVTSGATVPFSMDGRCCWSSTMSPVGPDEGPEARALIHAIAPDYFATLQVPVRGRELQWDDPTGEESVAVISRALADQLFPDADPLGESVRTRSRNPNTFRIVGVIDDLKHWSLSTDRDADIYVPHHYLAEFPLLSMAVRVRPGTEALVAETVRGAIRELDPNMPLPDVRAMDAYIGDTYASTRFLSTLLLVFAGLAVVLAAAGIYGTMLYTVSQRRREFGIRLALGATGRQVVRHVVREGAILTVIGVALGTLGGFGLARFLESLVFGVTTSDPGTFAAVAAILTGVALAACYFPARRAANTDPLTTLRAE